MGGIGGFLGWEGALFTLLLGSFFGLIPALVFLFRREKKVLRKAIPFGPFLALSAQVFYFVRFFFPSIVP
jgi:leader peptidase (prepilin peptidase)/N-methyltransferase